MRKVRPIRMVKTTYHEIDLIKLIVFNIKLNMAENNSDLWDQDYPSALTIERGILDDDTYSLIEYDLVKGFIVKKTRLFGKPFKDIPWKYKGGQPLYITWFGVDPKYQGKGFGKSLIRFIKAYAALKAHGSIRTLVDSDNIIAIKLLESFGFNKVNDMTYEYLERPHYALELKINKYYGRKEDKLKQFYQDQEEENKR